MELKQVGSNTYYIEGDTNVGIYEVEPGHVCLIDTGSKGYGEQIDEVISARGWIIDFIVNTHTHIDHIGGNKYLMEEYRIPAYCTDVDKTFAEYSDLEASYMNGGKPAGKLRHIFTHPGKLGFVAIEDVAGEMEAGKDAAEGPLKGLQWKALPGHTFGMIGVKTPDGVWFLGDAYLSKAYMEKRSFGYLVDAGEYLETLEMLKGIEGKLFVPAHGVAEEDINEILEMNKVNQMGLLEAVKKACSCGGSDDECRGVGLDEILQKMYEATMLRTNVANHALLSSTVKCYLTYLQDKGDLECEFVDNMMVWKAV